MPAVGRAFSAEESRKGGLVRQQINRAEIAKTGERMAFLHQIAGEMNRHDISASMLVAAVTLANNVATAQLPAPTNALEAQRMMEAAQIAHRILRLESSESTSNVATQHVDMAVIRQRLAELEAFDTTSE